MVEIVFNPQASTSFIETLTIHSDAINSTSLSINLNGTGTAIPVPPVADFSVNTTTGTS